MSQFYQEYMSLVGVSGMSTGFATLFSVLILWSLVWKGIALWKAARNNDTWWYVAMLVINTVGILEIVYIFFFANKKAKTTLMGSGNQEQK